LWKFFAFFCFFFCVCFCWALPNGTPIELQLPWGALVMLFQQASTKSACHEHRISTSPTSPITAICA
jgi:hypothetical protein